MALESRHLIKKRGELKGILTRFCNFVDKCNSENIDQYVIQLETRLENSYSLLEQFNGVQSDIEYCEEQRDRSDKDRNISDSQENENSDQAYEFERSEFENRYYNAIAVAKSLIKLFYDKKVGCNKPCSVASSSSSNNAQVNVRFPVIELPKFYGDYEKWGQFRDMFTSLVHNDSSMDNIKKFYYLLSCIKGDAAKIIENIEVTNDNYEVALNLLKSRYQNKYIIIKSHVSALVDFAPINNKDVHSSLRNLTDNLQKHIRSLKSLGEPVESWDTLLFHIISKKLDPISQREWESVLITSQTNKQALCLRDMINFLEKRCTLLETLNREKQANSEGFKSLKPSIPGFRRPFVGLAHNKKPNKSVCQYCKESKHEIYECEKFINLPVQSRYSEVKKLKLCTNCLRGGHFTFECQSQNCKKCDKHHNTLLHFQSNENFNKVDFRQSQSSEPRPFLGNPSNSDNQSDVLVTTVTANLCSNHEPQVLLSTAIILIQDINGMWHKCRALLDNGSQPNFISKKLFEKLQIPASGVNIPVLGVGNSYTGVNKRICSHIKSVHEPFELKLSFLVLDHIVDNLPTSSFDLKHLSLPKDINLADPQFNVTREIDLLLGAAVFCDLLGSNKVKLGSGSLFLYETRVGWIISGNLPSFCTSLSSTYCNLSTHRLLDNNLHEAIEKFWRVEELPQKTYLSREEQDCEDLFVKTMKRSESGRFIVTLPTRDNINDLKNNLSNALKRFDSVENKLKKNPKLRHSYNNFMKEYESLGHMVKVSSPTSEELLSSQHLYYLPHHCVYDEQYDKFRVVFDGSSKSSSGISLNDTLKVGPMIQDNLLNILLRFRGHSIVIVGDIEKMYRMVGVSNHQQNLQRIVWRDHPNVEIEHYRLLTVTYGTSSAAYQAIRCLQQVGIDNRKTSPQASEAILNDFYVDDLVTGTDSVDQAISLKNTLFHLLSQYGFKLRKWASNHKLLYDQNTTDLKSEYRINEDETHKMLGLIWKASDDVLTYIVNESELNNRNPTKRLLFSTISKIFDPLGLLAPVTIKAKILMQGLWKIKIDWDQPLPNHLTVFWNSFINQLVLLNNVNIPRHVVLIDSLYIEIHGFADASEKAYAAAIYIKSMNNQGKCSSNLLVAKTRVAPLKTISLPRLELCAALLLAQLLETVTNSIKFHVDKVYLWSDSSIVLSWLNSSPGNWKIFVANRVSEIQNLTQNHTWRYVPTECNPADIASRGIDPSQLINQTLWWQGPKWLQRHPDDWPENLSHLNDTNLEKRSSQVSLGSIVLNVDIFDKFSTYYRLQRVMALCLRFINNVRNAKFRITGQLTITELDQSLKALVKMAQMQSFGADLISLRKAQTLSHDSRLKNLDPFLDSDGVMRVGGRLSKSKLPYDTKHQIILCPKHLLTNLLILSEHHKQLHGGVLDILSSLRQQFWILNGRATVRSALRKCITCFRTKPKNIIRKMADLPLDRVSQNRPFFIVGVDFAGPFNIKDGKLRNRAIIKAYLCVFVCFTSKAVHLEVVSDLTTQSFLNCLKRFISRRGICKRIYSDNGTNFTGANNELKKLYAHLDKFVNDCDITSYLLKNSIEWRFTPPYSPHRGGLWEAAVKRAKYHAQRIIGKLTLTFEELTTIFVQIESIMNSRPLTPLSQDPNDLSALTPGHFLIGQPLTALPQTDLRHIPSSRLKQFEVLQQATQHFWSRWSNEYLQTLQKRSRWHQNSSEVIQPGSLVLLMEENNPPLLWRMGRVEKLHEGSDGIIRTVTVRTQSGLTVRALQKLCALPINDC